MSAVRNAGGYVVVEDRDGDRLQIEPTEETAHPDPFVVIVHAARGPSRAVVASVGLTLTDGLAVLSALADALGVTGTEPGEPTP